MKLLLASIFSLSLLFLFFFGIILGLLYVFGFLNIGLALLIFSILVLLQWLLSPKLMDLTLRIFSGLRWLRLEDLKEIDEELGNFIIGTCESRKIKVPKLGFIDDDNPQSFCYGSAAFNARIVLTQGIFKYLNTEERKAVVGHELGHIVNRDFIIMTIATAMLTFLYFVANIFIRASRGSRESREKGAGYLALIGIFAYFFYWIGSYVLLFLSRVREYYADEFSVKILKESDSLARALVKLCYGIIAMPETEKSISLMKATRTLGITDYKEAKRIGLAFAEAKKFNEPTILETTFLFDLYNPWAFLYELGSTHPLTAKRILRISNFYKVNSFDFEKLKNFPINRKLLYKNFFLDLFFNFLPLISIFLYPAIMFLVLPFSSETPVTGFILICGTLVVLGLSIVVRTLYRFPSKGFERSFVIDLLSDLYASPVRGRAVEIKGNIIGRGVPGYVFSEDMMLQDESNGLIYLNYEGWFPILSNLAFAFSKVKKLIGKNANVRGWFLRGLTARIELSSVEWEGKLYRSYAKPLGIVVGTLIILLGITLPYLHPIVLSLLFLIIIIGFSIAVIIAVIYYTIKAVLSRR